MCFTVALVCFVTAGRAADLYFDVNGSDPGFGSTTQAVYNQSGEFWNTSAAGNAAPVAFSAGNSMVFGTSNADFQGESFAINMDVSGNVALTGVTINATNVTITFQGGGNTYLSQSQTWMVPKGSVLNEAVTWAGKALNSGNGVHTMTGGGVINFITALGNNASGMFVVNDGGAGLTVNLFTNFYAVNRFYTNVTLTSGNLNFASAAASNALGTGTVVVLAGGKIDNTSGAPMTLTDPDSYVFSGNFAFGGSSSLNLGTRNVLLASSSAVTVSSNAFIIPGSITGSGPLVKAGAGVMELAGTNNITGGTAVSNGLLLVNGTLAGAVTVCSGAVLGGTGLVSDAVTVQSGGAIDAGGTNEVGTLFLGSSLSLGGTLTVDVNGAGQCDLVQGINALDVSSADLKINALGAISGHYYVIAKYAALTGRFARILNLPSNYGIEYSHNGANEIALVRARGTVLMIK